MNRSKLNSAYICELGEWKRVLSLMTAVIVYCFVVGDELLFTRTRSRTSRTSSSVAYRHINTLLSTSSSSSSSAAAATLAGGVA